MSNNRWTNRQISFIAECWGKNFSANRIADELAGKFGVSVSKHAVCAIARRYRDLMPAKTPAMLSQAMRDADRRFDRKAG